MLGQPVAVIAPALGVLREVERVPECLGGVAALDDRREIEDGEWRHVRVLETWVTLSLRVPANPRGGHQAPGGSCLALVLPSRAEMTEC